MKTGIAWTLIAIGLFMFFGFLGADKDHNLIVDLLTLLLFVAAPILGGASILYKKKKAREDAAVESKKLLYAAQEKEVLRLAEEKKGVLSVGQIVRETSMTANDAEQVLHELIVKGMADMRTSNDGQVLYEFREYADANDFERRKIEKDLLTE